MTLKQLRSKYQGKTFTGYGHYRVTFEFRGKNISAITTNMTAIDRITCSNEFAPKECRFFYTEKQAYQALYNEVLRKYNN